MAAIHKEEKALIVQNMTLAIRTNGQYLENNLDQQTAGVDTRTQRIAKIIRDLTSESSVISLESSNAPVDDTDWNEDSETESPKKSHISNGIMRSAHGVGLATRDQAKRRVVEHLMEEFWQVRVQRQTWFFLCCRRYRGNSYFFFDHICIEKRLQLRTSKDAAQTISIKTYYFSLTGRHISIVIWTITCLDYEQWQ